MTKQSEDKFAVREVTECTTDGRLCTIASVGDDSSRIRCTRLTSTELMRVISDRISNRLIAFTAPTKEQSLRAANKAAMRLLSEACARIWELENNAQEDKEEAFLEQKEWDSWE